jgi:hypothetical protein
MAKKPLPPPDELADNEEYISRDDLDIIITSIDEDETGEPTVWVRFSNFADMEEANEYAEFLENTLPLLLFETTRLQ